MRFCLVVIILFLVSCSSSKRNLDSSKILGETADIKSITVEIFPGHVRLLKFKIRRTVKVNSLKCRDEIIKFWREEDSVKAYISESYFSKFENYSCYLEIAKGDSSVSKKAVDIVIKSFKFNEEKLNVPKRKVDLSKKDIERWLKERDALKKVYSSSHQRPLFFEKFDTPLDSHITSIYGVKRLFNNKKQSQHLGTDYRAKIGVPIPVSNHGQVVFVGDLFFSGNTVIVDHGLNIFTMYAHLSKTNATVGEFIPKGSVIGISGMTGRVSGPHLHWGVKVQGKWVSGPSLVGEGI